jgi:FkbM family methyltransferase
LDQLNDVKFIIDCGAYVGYSSAYFLKRFPNAHVLAIEPDERNFEILRRNMAPYGNAVTLLRSAVWSHRVGLVVCKGQYDDGRDWATQVRECRDGEEPEVYAVDIGSLLDQSGFQRINVLKVDIEQAETVVFSRNYESWIDRVDTFVIELHDEKCREVFFNALQSGAFHFSRSGELTVAQRISVDRQQPRFRVVSQSS